MEAMEALLRVPRWEMSEVAYERLMDLAAEEVGPTVRDAMMVQRWETDP